VRPRKRRRFSASFRSEPWEHARWGPPGSSGPDPRFAVGAPGRGGARYSPPHPGIRGPDRRGPAGPRLRQADPIL